MKPHLMVIDPGVHTPEIDTFNLIAAFSPIPCTYHLPALFGFASFPQDFTYVQGIIVLGSAASVHDRLPWQAALEEWLRPAIDSDMPVLGCCYGHQMLAYMFGGDVGFIKETREKLKGVRRVNVVKNRLWNSGERRLIVTHAEAVLQLPAEFELLASSEDITIDGLIHRSKPVFGFQSHPEATKVFLAGHEMLDEKTLSVLSDGHALLREFVHMVAQRSHQKS